MRRNVAAIDCGTNSIRLLILAVDDTAQGPRITELTRTMRLARLGQGVDATREFHPEALERAFVVLDEFGSLIDAFGGAEVRVVATSAARDVTNRALFEDGVRARLGVDVDVISGDEEARLSAKGVLAGVEAPAPTLVIDIGGGSTEFIVLDASGAILSAISLNMGAVRVTERFLQADPPTVNEVAAARAWVREQLDSAGVRFEELASAVGVAGTVTSFAARKLALVEYEREAVHRTMLTREDIAVSTEHWLGISAADIAREPCMHPLRAQVLGGGALILDEIAARVPGGVLQVSESDILDGIALAMLGL